MRAEDTVGVRFFALLIPAVVVAISGALWRGSGLSLISASLLTFGLVNLQFIHNSPRPVVEGNLWNIREMFSNRARLTRFMITDAAGHRYHADPNILGKFILIEDQPYQIVLRCGPDGKLTINAGHIAPFVVGKELMLENGLPLGLAAESTYAECTFELAPGEQLTLVTDGVVEARDKAGVLLGFERSAALSTQPAEAIASAAQKFGQEDDITVLTLSCVGVPASS